MTGVIKIRKSVVDFQYNGNISGFDLQKEVREWVNNIYYSLDEVLSATTSASSDHYIEKLVLDVTLDTGTYWREEAARLVLAKLREKLQSAELVNSSNDKTSQQLGHPSFHRAFLYYIQKGHLPWNYFSLTTTEWNLQTKTLFDNSPENLLPELHELFKESKEARLRFLTNVPFSTALKFFAATDVDLINDIKILFKNFGKRVPPQIGQGLSSLMIAGLSNSQGFEELHFIRKHPEIQKAILSNSFSSSFLKNIKQFITSSVTTAGGHGTFPNQKEKKFSVSSEESIEVNQQPNLQNKLFQKMESPVSVEGETKIPEGEVYITNAGLILLAPYFTMLFKKIGLFKKGILHNPHKAAFIATYLTTGHSKIAEIELPFSKILCGLPISTGIDTKNFRISPGLKKECEGLLNSVIGHWSVLKNTSPEGLRNSFLKRNGKLYFNGDHYLLQVEKMGVDVLLEHLPWNISIVKLPWMAYPVKTEWV